jgi:hypothetical protein
MNRENSIDPAVSHSQAAGREMAARAITDRASVLCWMMTKHDALRSWWQD